MWVVGSLVATLGLSLAVSPDATAAKKRNRQVNSEFTLGDAAEQLREIETTVVEAEKATGASGRKSESQLAKQIVDGQLKLGDDDIEGAAVVFLDVLENYPKTIAASQANFFLGRALSRMGMEGWAVESFARNLADNSPDGERFHQRSVASLFDLAAPRRQRGFARQPGYSAMPEIRARLISLGIEVQLEPLKGEVPQDRLAGLERWVDAISPDKRSPELRYAYGRYLYLTSGQAGTNHQDRERLAKARVELSTIAPIDGPLRLEGLTGEWRIRAEYVAGAAALAADDEAEALKRFEKVIGATPRNQRDVQIVELAWLGQARIHHDAKRYPKALAGYRKISRDSPFFTEAMYETAWTQLAAGNSDRALHALDLLVLHDPDSPIIPEVKQLRGKIKIRDRDWQGAEYEFLALRKEFQQLGKNLEAQLAARGEANDYFAAVAHETGVNFDLTAVLPKDAVPIAKALPRVVEADGLAKESGLLRQELFELNVLLQRMEDAVSGGFQARLFSDLSAHLSSLDNADRELIQLQEALIRRHSQGLKGSGLAEYETQRKQLRGQVENPQADTVTMGDLQVGLRDLYATAHQYDLAISALRGQLVAAEGFYAATRAEQKIDPQQFLNQAAELRLEISDLQERARRVQTDITRTQTKMRFHDPWREAKRTASAQYTAFLTKYWSALNQARSDPEADALWNRSLGLLQRTDSGRQLVEEAAMGRLQRAVQIIREERVNIDQYQAELKGKTEQSDALVGEVVAAAYKDVVSEVGNTITRSEVGLLDIAWAIQEIESEEIRRLEMTRDRDIRELDRVLENSLEELH